MPTITKDLIIINKRGLHARASAKFVQTVEKFRATVSVSREGTTVGGNSIIGLMMLTASLGSIIRISATGPQAVEAFNAIEQLIINRFYEES
ncbi:Phosphocarrier protein, nitrogen regulation associated [Liberibacter crescens BT-1]|uniref:Phosphocarrier protein, nitrogen regulation associated n=1 Tax=Liberibacter crescens (strain BT-1) TaxID=1215343 RepID=L0EWL4_LIBCB|nr:HPr family phosphocarrier protein [Liberibacter crescens]AGA65352.1 Phosphocarrier protein, nitrogen regulation associated [Liberibacter crescens BT-1]AMC12292.1 phosphate ABC transporter permease [Liberibacter crescens]